MSIVGKIVGRGVPDTRLRWRTLTASDFGALIVGSGGAFWSSLTFDAATERWTGTWAGTHPGTGSGYRPAHRVFSPLSTCCPDYLQDGTQGVVLDVFVDSFSNANTDARFMAGVGDSAGAATGTEQGIALLLDDIDGTNTQLNGATAVAKTGGSLNYAGVPDRCRLIWLPGGDPTASGGVGGTGAADFYAGATRLLRSGPGTLTTQWTGELGIWFGAAGVAAGLGGGSIVFGARVAVFDTVPDVPPA